MLNKIKNFILKLQGKTLSAVLDVVGIDNINVKKIYSTLKITNAAQLKDLVKLLIKNLNGQTASVKINGFIVKGTVLSNGILVDISDNVESLYKFDITDDDVEEFEILVKKLAKYFKVKK